MDDIVRQAMAKWPNVPHCYGWLGLDARGNWYMRDDRVQAAGPFAPIDGGSAASKGSLLKHDKLIDFIQRNYTHDDLGQWFFQNGPQRVYVELENTPWVWRVQPDFSVVAHSGQQASVSACVVDGAGYLYLETNLGFGLVHTQDMTHAADAIEQGLWQPQLTSGGELAAQHRFVRSPAARKAEKEKAGH